MVFVIIISILHRKIELLQNLNIYQWRMFQAMLDHEFHQCEISVFEIGQGSIHNLVMGSYDGLYLVVINIVSGYFMVNLNGY